MLHKYIFLKAEGKETDDNGAPPRLIIRNLDQKLLHWGVTKPAVSGICSWVNAQSPDDAGNQRPPLAVPRYPAPGSKYPTLLGVHLSTYAQLWQASYDNIQRF